MENWLTDWISNPTSILAAIAVIALLWHGARWTQRMEAGQQTLRDGLKGASPATRDISDAAGTPRTDAGKHGPGRQHETERR